jgi:hypothetical protein
MIHAFLPALHKLKDPVAVQIYSSYAQLPGVHCHSCIAVNSSDLSKPRIGGSLRWLSLDCIEVQEHFLAIPCDYLQH